MASIVIFGAAGRLGSRLVCEAASRDHQVTAVVHGGDPEPAVPNSVTVVRGEATSPETARSLAPGTSAMIVAVGGPDKTVYLRAARTLVSVLSALKSDAPRIIHSGGGGSLLKRDGTRIVDSPEFPSQVREEALGQGAALDFYRSSAGVTWTYVSPPPGNFAPGARRGHYRTGTDHPVVDERGVSGISYEDYAIAVIDEIEAPAHLNTRFTVGY